MNETTYVFPNANYTDLTLYQFGAEKCTPMLSCGPALRNHYLLHYVLSGRGVFTSVDGTDHHITPGQGFLIHPNSVSFYCADDKEPWHYIWVEFDGLRAASFLLEAGLGVKSPVYTPALGKAGLLRGQLEYLVENPNEAPPNLIGHLYLIMDTLIKTSVTRSPRRQGNLKEFYVREAINYIEQNYNRQIGVADIAYWCNLNRSYFGKIFKDTVLVTPQEYLLKYRMSKACDLLEDESLPISEVAARVGVENPLNFSRAFKNMYGVSPRDWRKSTAGLVPRAE